MTAEVRYYIYLQDEAPRIGAGWRPVMASIGYKWVKLRPTHAERGTKIRRAVWDSLKKRENQVHADSN